MSSKTGSSMAGGAKGTPTSAQNALTTLSVVLMNIVTFVLVIILSIAVNQELSIATSQNDTVLSFMLFIAIFMLISGMLCLFRNVLSFSLEPTYFTGICIFSTVLLLIMLPQNIIYNSDVINTIIQLTAAFEILLLISIRPRYGPEANQRIYQSYSSIVAFITGACIVFLGIYILYWFQLSNYAGSGTYPDNQVYLDYYIYYIEEDVAYYMGENFATLSVLYSRMINSGVYILIGAGLIMAFSITRKFFGSLISSIIVAIGSILVVVGIGLFETSFNNLKIALATYAGNIGSNNPLLILSGAGRPNPPVFQIGFYLFVVALLSAIVMLISTFMAKPIEKWRHKRNQYIVAAQVATKEQRLPQAVSYLEKAAEFSSKIDEEDKAIELMTRIKQIQDKAIKMRKSQAAQQAKKDYERQRKSEARKKKEKPSKKAPQKKNDKSPPKKKVD